MTGSIVAASTPYELDLLTNGESTMPRGMVEGAATCANQILRLGYFTARKSETVNNVWMQSFASFSGGTPTLIRIGLWTAGLDGALLSLVASTANDTTLFAASNTPYPKALQAGYAKVAGQRYAMGLLVVTSFTGPSTLCGFNASAADAWNRSPRMQAAVTGQSDLPGGVVVGSLANSNFRPYIECLP